MKRFEKWLVFLIMAILLAFNVSAESGTPLPSLAVTVDDYVYGSERSTPVVSGNLEGGAESYFIRRYSESGGDPWKEIDQRPVSLGMPTEGGRYELKVTVGATEGYSGGSAFCDFYVLPTDLDIGLSVKESIFFGDSCGEGGLFSLTDLLGREYTVTFSERGKNNFTSAPPTGIGAYTLKVSVAASDNFNATEKTADFEIKKRAVGGELKLDDVTVIFGKEAVTPPRPVYVGDSELVKSELLALSPIAEYRPLGSEENFTEAVPTRVGEYELRVSFKESKNLHAASVTSVLRITRSPISPSVSIIGWTYGDTPYEPRLADGSNPGGGRVYYYYKPEGGEYSTAFPSDAGKYTLKVVIESASGYSGGECFTEFIIEKAERRDARLVFGDARYGERLPTPYVSGTHDGAEVIFSYSRRGENDFSPEPPSESGEYTLRAEIAEGKNYKAKTVTFDFIIEKADIYAGIFVENRVFGDTEWTVAVSGNDGGGDYTLSYFIKTPSGYSPVPKSELIEGRPFMAGEYKVICEIFESKNHKGSITEGRFTIERATPTVSVTMDSYTFYGKAPTPTVNGNGEDGDVSFVYYPKGGEISSGSYDVTEAVRSPGEYTVAAVISQTRNYKTATVTCDFTVHKADLPVSSIALVIKSGGAEVAAVSFGSDFELSLRNNVGYGAVSFSYQTENGYTLQKPTAVGKYKVKADVSATDIYKSLTIFFDFEIVKATRTDIKLEPAEFIYGDEGIGLILSGNKSELSDEQMSFLYKPMGSDLEYVEEPPVKAGKYEVKLILPETDSYLGAELYSELTIKKAPSLITVGETEAVFSGERIDLDISLNHSEAELTIEGDDPIEVGEYSITISVPETENYEAASITVTLSVVAAPGEILDLQIPDSPWSGEPITAPTFTVKGDGTVSVEYFLGDRLLDGAPSEVGEYTVRVTLSDGKNYTGCTAEKVFRITAVSAETAGETSAPSTRGDSNRTIWLIIALILATVAAGVISAIAIARSHGDGGTPPTPPEPRDSLPPSDGEGADALNPPISNDALIDGKGGAPDSDDPEKEKQKKSGIGKRIERLTESGKIALDMWLNPTDDASEVVYKKRGRYAEINIDTLCRHFEDGETVDLNTLKEKGLVNKSCKRVKLLGRGELTKKLDIKLNDCSKSAKESIEAVK